MRKQYFIDSYKFKNVKEKDGKLIFNESDKVSYSISENSLFKKLYEVIGKEYHIEKSDPYKLGEVIKLKARPQDNPLDGMFILKANTVKKDKMDDLYDKAVRDGIYINNEHYLYAEKSASMIRTQKTVFIKEDIKDKLVEYLTLGKKCDKCVTAKWLTTQGYLLSSVDVVDILPRIVVIEDFKNIVPKDVYIMEDYKPTDKDKKEYEKYLKDKALEDDDYKKYKEQIKKANELFKGDYLPKYFKYERWDICDSIKSRNGWKQVGRRIMTEEVLNPFSYCEYKGKYHPIYEKSQTEEIKIFPVKPYIIGKDKVLHENYPCEINCFDGEGIMSFDFAEKVKEKLGVNYNINSIQMRIPFVKTNVIRVDWKNWMLEHGIKYIQPMSFNDKEPEPVNIMDVDIIITESCFKAKLEKADGKNSWLFDSMTEYYDLLKKYNYTYFGIANHSEPHFDNEYNQITYQIINSTEMNYHDLVKLANEEALMLKKVKQGDTAYVKKFLNIIAHKNTDTGEFEDDEEIEEEDYKNKAKVFYKAIELNERFVFDNEIQNFLCQRIKNYYQDMKIGRILIPSQYLVATGDIIAFLEWTAYRDKDKVKGFITGDDVYCNGKNQDYVIARYPQTHFSELSVHKFIENDDKYIKHLDNVIQCSIYSSIMFRKNLDFDGDKLYLIKADLPLSKDRTFKDVIIGDYPIFNPDDKATTNASEFNTDAILKFEHLNLEGKTGQITNLNSTYQTMALGEGSLWKRDFESSLCKALQGEQIDSAKKGTEVIIPDELKENAWQKSYFMKHIYGESKSSKNEFMIPMSPLDFFSQMVEEKYNKLYPADVNHKDVLEIPEDEEMRTYLDIPHIYDLMMCSVDSDVELSLLSALQPIFNKYSHEKGEIWKENRGLNRLSRKEEDKDKQKLIKQKYKQLYDDTREKTYNAYKKLYGEVDEPILASVCVEIEYVQAKQGLNGFKSNRSFNFPWIVCPEGIIQNIKMHEDPNKTLIINARDIEEGINTAETIKVLGKKFVIKNVTKVPVKENEANPKSKIDKTLKDFHCSLVNCVGDEAAKKLDGKVARLSMENGYYSLFINNKYIASIPEEKKIDLKKHINLKDFLERDVKIKVDKINKRSLKVILESA